MNYRENQIVRKDKLVDWTCPECGVVYNITSVAAKLRKRCNNCTDTKNRDTMKKRARRERKKGRYGYKSKSVSKSVVDRGSLR